MTVGYNIGSNHINRPSRQVEQATICTTRAGTEVYVQRGGARGADHHCKRSGGYDADKNSVHKSDQVTRGYDEGKQNGTRSQARTRKTAYTEWRTEAYLRTRPDSRGELKFT